MPKYLYRASLTEHGFDRLLESGGTGYLEGADELMASVGGRHTHPGPGLPVGLLFAREEIIRL